MWERLCMPVLKKSKVGRELLAFAADYCGRQRLGVASLRWLTATVAERPRSDRGDIDCALAGGERPFLPIGGCDLASRIEARSFPDPSKHTGQPSSYRLSWDA
jgi:hypothetical protein